MSQCTFECWFFNLVSQLAGLLVFTFPVTNFVILIMGLTGQWQTTLDLIR